MENNDIEFNSRLDLQELQASIYQIRTELAKVIVGQKQLVNLLLTALLAEGHVLLEGAPGVAKTITAKLLAKSLAIDFNRIQFTPDLMPSDILGTSVFNLKDSEFEFKKGPVFSNIVLIDEINRAPAKTQAALFETMEERQATIDGTTYPFEAPFMVLATQNPIDQEGTYALPEAQLDRFLFKIKITYPSVEDEIKIIETHHNRKGEQPQTLINPILSTIQLAEFKTKVQDVIVEEKIIKYIAELVSKTRNHPHLYIGASPRASIAILNTSKAFAAVNGRDFVIPEDVKKALKPILNHRIILTPEHEMEGMTTENVIDMIEQSVEVPR